MRRTQQGEIYFIRDPGRGIKIGFATTVAKRFAAIQVCSPVALELLGHISGSPHVERFLHQKLDEHRVRGEWFRDTPEINALVLKLLEEGAEALGFKEPSPSAPCAIIDPEYAAIIEAASIFGQKIRDRLGHSDVADFLGNG